MEESGGGGEREMERQTDVCMLIVSLSVPVLQQIEGFRDGQLRLNFSHNETGSNRSEKGGGVIQSHS